MNTEISKITIHMASSLDGFIAKKDETVSWMNSTDNYEKGIGLTEEKITEFLNYIDCYVMGSKTYEHAIQLGWPYGNKPVFVLTKKNLDSDKETLEFCSGDLEKVVNEKIKSRYKNIWMVGGSKLTKEFIRLDLADKIVLVIIPIILGDGLLFFDHVGMQKRLHLENVTAYKDGMVELTYEILRD